MFDKILIVCAGNICRSPFAEVVMKKLLPQKNISSAGLITAKSRLEGKPASEPAQILAKNLGYNLLDHKAKQTTTLLLKEADLILVMEQEQKKSLQKLAPEVTGKTMLMSHWCGEYNIFDPYQKAEQAYLEAFAKVQEAAKAWSQKLS